MPEDRKLVVGLLSHYFEDENLGCVALSISNIILLDEVADRMGVSIEYRILVNEKHPDIPLTFTESPYSYGRYSSTKKSLRHPIRMLRTRIFDDCDLVFNINAGDGFTDLYGFPRMLSESYMSVLAGLKNAPLVVAPQTIGPFSRALSRSIAKSILQRAEHVFSRDEQSTSLARSLGLGKNVSEVIDVAFALPYTRRKPVGMGPLNVGVNVSGLLYRGGYNGKNFFDLSFDYKQFTDQLVGRLLEMGVTVHLVPHVISSARMVEDDYSVCEAVRLLHPSTIIAPRFEGPIEAKSYIAGLDFFTGARMHSTVAALSSGVPVVPIGYSKKLPGLYNTLEYPYYIDAREGWTADSAVEQIVSWLEQVETLHAGVAHAAEVYADRLEKYRTGVQALFSRALEER